MITYLELLNGHLISDVPIAAQQNLEILLTKINKIRDAYGVPMKVTSGYRTLEEHFRIYSTIAFKKGVPYNRNAVPTKSNHLYGRACDIMDKDGKLYCFAFENQKLLEAIGLWCEVGTKGWVHFQICAPISGNRFFLP